MFWFWRGEPEHSIICCVPVLCWLVDPLANPCPFLNNPSGSSAFAAFLLAAAFPSTMEAALLRGDAVAWIVDCCAHEMSMAWGQAEWVAAKLDGLVSVADS